MDEAQSISLESSVMVKGKVVKDDRQIGGVEMSASVFEIISRSEEYPISKKEQM